MKSTKLSIASSQGRITERITGGIASVEILLVTREEIKAIHKKDGWVFNWKTEYNKDQRQLYKLTVIGNPAIQGLLSLEPIKEQQYIEMHLIETAPHNKGMSRQFFGIARHLVAFACKTSVDMGFEGYVAFSAKTKLVLYYIQKFGAKILFRDRMGIFPDAAKDLINLYHK